jgi:seryl-tRNA synthetase
MLTDRCGRVALQKKLDATELIQSTEEIKTRLAAKEAEVQEAKTTLDAKLVTIGNIVHDSVPVSDDEVRSKCKSYISWFYR